MTARQNTTPKTARPATDSPEDEFTRRLDLYEKAEARGYQAGLADGQRKQAAMGPDLDTAREALHRTRADLLKMNTEQLDAAFVVIQR